MLINKFSRSCTEKHFQSCLVHNFFQKFFKTLLKYEDGVLDSKLWIKLLIIISVHDENETNSDYCCKRCKKFGIEIFYMS